MEIKVIKIHDYIRKEDIYHGQIENEDFSVYIYPDTAKSLLGRKRQILKVGRKIIEEMKKPLKKPRVSHLVGYQPHKTNIYEYYTSGPSSDYDSYINKARKKNRPGYITDSLIQIRVVWKHHWTNASEKTWALASQIRDCLI